MTIEINTTHCTLLLLLGSMHFSMIWDPCAGGAATSSTIQRVIIRVGQRNGTR